MYNGRRRSQGEGGGDGVMPPSGGGQGEAGIRNVRIECDICLDTCHHPTSTQCCQAQVSDCQASLKEEIKACRHCALSYVLRNKSCWSCGADTEGKTGLSLNEKVRNEIERLKLTEKSFPIHCDLCNQIAKKGVRTTCCGGRACRSCARKFTIINRTCWSLSCPGVDSILEPNKILDSAVETFHRTGALHQEQLQKLENVPVNKQSEDSNSLPSGQQSDNSSELSKSQSRVDEDQNSEDDVSEINADSPQRNATFNDESMELESDLEAEAERQYNQDAEEVDDPNSTEEKSNKSEIVVSDESDSEIQEISPEEVISNGTSDTVDEANNSSGGKEPSNEKASEENGELNGAIVNNNIKNELEDGEVVEDDLAAKVDDEFIGKRPAGDDSSESATPSTKKRKISKELPSEFKCVALGDVDLVLGGDNFILLHVERLCSSAFPHNVHINSRNVQVTLSKEFTSLLGPNYYLQNNSEGFIQRVLTHKQYSFILINIRVNSHENASRRDEVRNNVKIRKDFCVAMCTKDTSCEEQQVTLHMTACVDFSMKDVFLKPGNSKDEDYSAVKTYLKFQVKENVSKRHILEAKPVQVPGATERGLQRSHHRYEHQVKVRYKPNIIAKSLQNLGKEIYMCKNMMVCEVTACDNNQSIPRLLDIFGYKIENISDSSSELEEGVTSNDDIHEEDKEEGEIIDINTGLDKENNDPSSNKQAENKQPSFDELDEKSKKVLYEKKMKEGHEFFAKACYMSAAKKYSEALQLDPSSAIGYSWRSNCQFHLNNIKQALDDGAKSVELDAKLPEAYLSAMKASIANGSLQEAKDYLDKLDHLLDEKEGLEHQANESKATITRLETLEVEIKRCMDAKEYAKGLDTVKDCLHQCRYSNKYKILKAELLAYVGGFEESNRIINELKGFSMNADCLYVKALGQYYKDSLDLSSHFLKDVMTLDKQHEKALALQSKITEHKELNDKIQAAMKGESLEQGLEACQEALKVDPENKNLMSRVYYLRGRVYTAHEKHLEAIAEYGTAVQLNSLNSKAYFSRSKSYLSLELYEEALKDAEIVIRHESGNSSFRQLYSQVKGKYDEYKNCDFYKLLGVEKTSSQEEIRKAYRKAALVHHPDRHSSKHEMLKAYHERRFKDIGEAYGVLSDEAKRLLYDKGLLNKSIPTPSPAQPMPHFTNISNVAMQNAAFWASVVQQQRQGLAGTGLAGARPGTASAAGLAGLAGGRASAAAGLAGASPFAFFMPAGSAAAGTNAASYMGHTLYTRGTAAQFGYSQFRYPQSHFSQNPYGKF